MLRTEAFFDPASATFSYVVFETDGADCAIIDSVLGYDAASGRTSTTAADRILAFVEAHRLRVQWLLETHAHADHLSAAAYLRRRSGGRIGISARIGEVQSTFREAFSLEPEFRIDGSQFDHLFEDGERFFIGSLPAVAMQVPGHTPADLAYRIGDDAVFVGDTLFMPDVGTARCDFPGGDPALLYRSIRRLLSLPPATRLFLCHDYPPPGRAAACETTVGAQRAANIHVRDGIGEAEFAARRRARDATLGLPALIAPAIQVNIRAGELPPPDASGKRFLKIPLDVL
ncbi:metallo-beta-lactamase superfamily protein [Azoarcus olearius]|uniref:MBL fold metallo-hydrolase n=1 Tax=Azoarcus sp. (strain BH72) TaxID=418699 RepID=UPI00080614B5|nr:MBL fold metallo-hydrolase [Azoarcus olearius]ANQ85660.1 metallo-beta-lactamase superfamily protein [Azoarcus olearius]